jgi:DNA polymerase-3 subunit epsilon
MSLSKPLYIYADLETESLKGYRILQIAAITEKGDKFSIYINPHGALPDSCFQITGLHFYKNQLYRHGQVLPSVSITNALQKFKSWLGSFEQTIHLIFHNAFPFDMQVLVRHFSNQKIPFPSNVLNVHDTLPAFRKFIKVTEISGFKLGTLAQHFDVPLVDAHNAIDDAECLKNLCEAFVRKNDLKLDDFLNNYIKPVSYFQLRLKQKN